MVKQLLMIISICWGISSSAYSATLTAQEREELETLQKSASRLKEIATNVHKKLQEQYGKTSTQWITPPEKDALPKLAEICKTPTNPLPAIFPLSKDAPNVPNMLQFTSQMRQTYKVDFFRKASEPCFKALMKRKSTGEGLTFNDREHLAKTQEEFDDLGQMMGDLLPFVDSIHPIFSKYSSKFCTIYFLIMQSENGGPLNPKLASTLFQDQFKHDLRELEHRAKPIEPSLKTMTGTVGDEFIKAILFLDAVLDIYAPALNAWGALLQMHAIQYEKCGDRSLVPQLPKV